MSVVDTLTSGGIQRAPDVVTIAAAQQLDLSAAAALLWMESSGGLNLWGHDGVSTGGTYVKGSTVTQAAYLAYKARRSNLGCQGVGPCQLTAASLQDTADAQGGCWRWEVNCAVGFKHLAQLIAHSDMRTGFRAYNGSGPAAERYATRAMDLFANWRQRLAGQANPAAGPVLAPGSTSSSAVAALQRVLNKNYPLYSHLVVDGVYGPLTAAAVREFQRRSGLVADGVAGPATLAKLGLT